jgi:hypothetical protein
VQAQRDAAQDQVKLLTQERDEARAEIARLTELANVPQALASELRAQDARPAEPITLDQRARRTEPQRRDGADSSGDAHQRATTPPPADALEAALLASRKLSPPPLPVVQPDAAIESAADPPPTARLRRHNPPAARPAGMPYERRRWNPSDSCTATPVEAPAPMIFVY